MTLEEILLSAKEKAQRSAGQWLNSEYQRKGVQHIPQIEAKVKGRENTIEVVLLMQGNIRNEDVPVITEYSKRFVVDMLGYLNTGTLRNTQKVTLLAGKKIGERLKPIFYHEYRVERTGARNFQATMGGTVFPIIHRYYPNDTRSQILYPGTRSSSYSEVLVSKPESPLRAAMGAIRDLFNAIRYSR